MGQPWGNAFRLPCFGFAIVRESPLNFNASRDGRSSTSCALRTCSRTDGKCLATVWTGSLRFGKCIATLCAGLEIGHVLQERAPFAQGLRVSKRQIRFEVSEPSNHRFSPPVAFPRRCPSSPRKMFLRSYTTLLCRSERGPLGRDLENMAAVASACRKVADPGAGLLAKLNRQAGADWAAIAKFWFNGVPDCIALLTEFWSIVWRWSARFKVSLCPIKVRLDTWVSNSMLEHKNRVWACTARCAHAAKNLTASPFPILPVPRWSVLPSGRKNRFCGLLAGHRSLKKCGFDALKLERPLNHHCSSA